MKYITLKPDRQTFNADNENENGVRPPQPNDNVKVNAAVYGFPSSNATLELTNGAYCGVTIDQEGLYNLPLIFTYNSQAGGRFELTNTKITVAHGATTADTTQHEAYIAIQVSTGDEYVYCDDMRTMYGYSLSGSYVILPNGNYWLSDADGLLYDVKYATKFRESYVEAVPGVSYIKSEGKTVYNELPLIAIDGESYLTCDELKITDKVLEQYRMMAKSGRFPGEAYNIILHGRPVDYVHVDSDYMHFQETTSELTMEIDTSRGLVSVQYPAPPS